MKNTPEEDPPSDCRGLPIATDPNATSASADLPAFLAKPLGAPIYHGLRILEDVDVDGFRLGIISDFELEPALYGDAFVVAPDGSRAGLVWEAGDAHTFQMVCEETDGRWGVWAPEKLAALRGSINRRASSKAASLTDQELKLFS